MALSSVPLISVNPGAVRSHLCICPTILISYIIFVSRPMKHVVKILSLLVAVSAVWISLLQAAIIPRTHTWLLPIYFVVSLGCYGLLMVGIGLMQFPTCPQEAVLLQHDIADAKDFLTAKGIDIGPE